MAAPFTANNGDTCANRGRDRHQHRRPRRDSFRGNRDHLDCQWLQSFARAGRDHRQFRNDQRHRPRAIGTSGSSVPRHFTLWNRAGGLITASRKDAFQIGNDIGDGTVNVYNYGTILSTGGQGLDFDTIASTTGHVNIINYATAIIKSTANDAIRPGQGATVTNYGLIFSDGAVGASNDGIDWQGHSGTVINKSGGAISGFRHGITTDVDVNVFNEAGGTIIGRNGSGVGSHGAGTVVNYGRITDAADGSGDRRDADQGAAHGRG
jgi:hypothetical protein